MYRDRSDAEIRDISIARQVSDKTGSQTWQTHPVHVDGWRITGCPVNGPRAVADGQRVAVAWYTIARNQPRVRVAFSSNAGASFDPPIDIDSPHGRRSPIGRVDIVMDKSSAIVTWMASEGESARVLARRVAPDRRLSDAIPLIATQAGRAAGFPRLARLGNQLVLTWTETSKPSRVRAMHLPIHSIPSPRATSAP